MTKNPYFWRQKVEYFGHTLSRIGPCHFSSFSLTSCKKSEKSDSGKYENFCDRLTDRRTDEIWRTANSIEHNKHYHNSNWTNKNVRSCLSARKSPHPLNLRTMIIFELEKWGTSRMFQTERRHETLTGDVTTPKYCQHIYVHDVPKVIWASCKPNDDLVTKHIHSLFLVKQEQRYNRKVDFPK